MEITAKNTINSGNEKKALIGDNAIGNPAYYFSTPLINFNNSGIISFKHKLNANNGSERELFLLLIDRSEDIKDTLYHHIYLNNGNAVNGNPTNVVNASVNVNWSGAYFLRWVFNSSGGSSLAMVDDISIDGNQVSTGANDNGYGYCREDDVVYDTVCASSLVTHSVPYAIASSDWQWSFNGMSGGTIDSTLVDGNTDTTIAVMWDSSALGDYVLTATEIRPPHNTSTYSVDFNIHVEPFSNISLEVDSVCKGEKHEAKLNFAGTAPWQVSYTYADTAIVKTCSSNEAILNLPVLDSTTTIQVTDFQDGNNCTVDSLPQVEAFVYPAANTGAIKRY